MIKKTRMTGHLIRSEGKLRWPVTRGSIAALLFPLCLAGCMGDGSIEVTGRVVSDKGEPIEGALIHMDISRKVVLRTTTDTNGGFDFFELIAPGHYTVPLIVEAKGFTPARLDIQAQREHRILVKLAPADSAAESAIVHAPSSSAPPGSR